eukprot:1966963-Amphidinium_carterae.1
MQLELILDLLQIRRKERINRPQTNQVQFRVSTSPRTMDADLELSAQTFILVYLRGHNINECDKPKLATGVPPKPKGDGKNAGGKGKGKGKDTGKSTGKGKGTPPPVPPTGQSKGKSTGKGGKPKGKAKGKAKAASASAEPADEAEGAPT